MKKLLIIFCGLLLWSCKTEQDKPIKQVDTRTVVINGHIMNYNLQDSITSVKVYGYDNLLNQDAFDYDIDKEGRFKVEYPLDRQQDLKIYYKNWITLLVRPGDSLSISFDGNHKNTNELFSSIEIRGDAENVNKQLFKFLSNDNTLDSYYEGLQKLDPDNYLAYHDSIFAERDKYIQSFLNTSQPLDEDLISWLAVEQHIRPAMNLLGFPLWYRMTYPKKAQDVKYSTAFFKSLQEIPKLEDKHLINGSVASFGNYYLFHYYDKVRIPGERMTAETRDSLVLRSLIEDNKDNLFLARLAIVDKIKSELQGKKTDFVDREKQLLLTLFQASALEKPIFNTYQEVIDQIAHTDLPKDAELIIFKSKNSDNYLDEIINNANGKVIYIDSWATWCAPCRSQFKDHTAPFKEKYGDKVEFVYLCYKSEKALWKPLIAEYKLSGKHYFIEDSVATEMANQVQLNGYPTYTIIDQKGRIVKAGFQYRPSEAVTSQIIDDLLND